MPRTNHMSWDAAQTRWTKMYKDRRYTVACSVLNAPPTKDASRSAANAWWEAKKREIDGEAASKSPRSPLPLEDLAEATHGLGIFSDWRMLMTHLSRMPPEFQVAVQHWLHSVDPQDRLPGSPAWEKMMEVLRSMTADELLRRLIAGDEVLPTRVAENLPPDRVHQIEDGAREIRGTCTTPAERTFLANAETWLQTQQARVNAGQMTAARCANNRTCLEQLKAFLGPQADVGGIDAAKLEGFYQHCLVKITAGRRNVEGGWSVSYARDVFSVAKAFIRWLVERGTIDPPRNLASKSFKFGSPAKAVQTWTVDEFKAAIHTAPGKLKLALLLMANTGATQEDVSELKDTEVDWRAGRIIRKRSKTAAHESVPVVSYRLWPTTFELLKKYRSGTERVLLTKQGEPYVRGRLREDGRLSKADGFASNYVHLKKKLKRTMPTFRRSLKELRKLGASLLSTHSVYGRFQSYFLGHSPRTVAERHYEKPPAELFDQAVMWLGQQLGQVPVEGKPTSSSRFPNRRRPATS